MIILKRLISFAWRHFWRNSWLSFITITVITVSVLSVNIVISVDYLKHAALELIRDKVDISVALRQNISADEVDKFASNIRSLKQVESVEIITPQENKERFGKVFPKIVDEAFPLLDENPLPYRLVIQPKTIADNDTIVKYLLDDARKDMLGQQPELEDYRTGGQRIETITGQFNMVASIIAILFLLFAVLIVYNTVRISLYTQRDEIGIMKLVGATNWFIRAPYFIETVVSSLLATILAMVLFYGSLSVMTPYLTVVIGDVGAGTMNYFSNNLLLLLGLEFVGVLFIQVCSVSLALRRYLRV